MRRIGVLAVALAGGLALVPTAAVAAGSGLSSHKIAGVQSEVSCLSANLCVAVGYNNHSVGDVVPIKHGKPAKAATIHNTGRVSSVSCPNSHGCVALAQVNGDVKARFVKINSHGVPTGGTTVTPPAGVTLAALACTSLTSCVVGGAQFFTTPMAFEVGVWNGKHLSLHKVHGLTGSTTLGIQGVGCAGSTCWIVGTAGTSSGDVGIALPVTKHKAGKPQKVHGLVQLGGVACSSSTHCYAAGFPQSGGAIVDLSRTKVGSHHTVSSTAPLYAIGCHKTHCTAVGEQLDSSSKTSFTGVAINLVSGKVAHTHVVAASGGFTGVAQPGSTAFTAVGASSAAAIDLSEVTTG